MILRTFSVVLFIATCSCKAIFSDPIEEFAQMTPRQITEQMSLEEKVGQIIHIGMSGKTIGPATRTDIEKYHVGGIILFEVNLGSATEIKTLTTAIQEIEKQNSKDPVPILVSSDQEGGRVVRVKDGVDQLPGGLAVGSSGSEQMAHDVGFITGLQMSRLGIPFILAPDVDVNNNPANPVINTRSFGGDAQTVTKIALAYARGVRQSGAIPVIKHFPGHGNTNTDSHTALPTISRDLAQMEQVEIVPFKAGIDQGVPVIMSAHIVFPALDPTEPATLSSKILKEYLRKKLGYRGLITTDALEMKAVADRYPVPVLARKAFTAGVDILLLTSSGERTRLMYESLLIGFQKGELSLSDLDAAVTRQIEIKIRSGLFHKYGMTRTQWSQDVSDAFSKRDSILLEEEAAVRSRYPDGLNAAVSRSAISSLRKPYNGLTMVQKSKLSLFYRNAITADAARAAGIMEAQITQSASPVSSAAAVFAGFCRVGAVCPETMAVEMAEMDLWRWNQLVQEMKDAGSAGRPVPTLIALYTGNPYLNVRVPGKGAVICSFSPTDESVKALVYRLAQPSPVREAKLVLADEK